MLWRGPARASLRYGRGGGARSLSQTPTARTPAAVGAAEGEGGHDVGDRVAAAAPHLGGGRAADRSGGASACGRACVGVLMRRISELLPLLEPGGLSARVTHRGNARARRSLAREKRTRRCVSQDTGVADWVLLSPGLHTRG